MTVTTISLLVCSTIALVLSLPAPDERAMQPLSAAMSGNYTVSFAPLLAVLLNVFPRLMSAVRLPAVQPLTATTHARGLEPLWEWERASLCSALESFTRARGGGGGGGGPSADCFFYSCSPSDAAHCPPSTLRYQAGGRSEERLYRGTELVSETEVDECTRLAVRRCRDPRARYRPDADACVTDTAAATACHR